jgi:hypothetical protein
MNRATWGFTRLLKRCNSLDMLDTDTLHILRATGIDISVAVFCGPKWLVSPFFLRVRLL